MLQRQESDENNSLPEQRVTTDEFTQAVAALEARKEEERQRLAGTVPIAQTVQDLGIDAKPDEIWAEVQAQRAHQAAAQVPPPQSALSEQQALVSNNPFQSVFPDRPRRQRRVRWFPILLLVFFATRLIHANIQQPLTKIDNGTPSAPVAASQDFPAEFQDGQTVYCSNDTLIKLQHGQPLSQLPVYENGGGNDWKLVKYNGHIYLQGYTLPLSAQTLHAKSLKIYSSLNVMDKQNEMWTPITIRLDKNQYRLTVGGDNNEVPDWSEITVSSPHLDSHARETWSP